MAQDTQLQELLSKVSHKITLEETDQLFEFYKQHIDLNATKPELYNNPVQWSNILKALKQL
jgi:predicted transcriptional regulator